MPWLVDKPALIRAEGRKPKEIEEYVGRINTGHRQVSVARMVSPAGWSEPAQCPRFLEVTVVLRGQLLAEHEQGEIVVSSGQALVARPGESIRYSTPGPDGAEYVAVCLPAYSPETVNRE